MTPRRLPRSHERAAREFVATLRAAGCRALTAQAVERGFRWWWALDAGTQARTVRAISKRVVELLEEELK